MTVQISPQRCHPLTYPAGAPASPSGQHDHSRSGPVSIDRRRLLQVIRDDARMLRVTQAVQGTSFAPARADLLAWLEQTGAALRAGELTPAELQAVAAQWQQRRAVWRHEAPPAVPGLAPTDAA